MKLLNFWKRKISANKGKLKRKFAKAVSLSGFGIGSLNQTSSNWVGWILIIIGFIAGFFWLRGGR